MKIAKFAAACAVFVVTGCAADLVVTDLHTTGTPTVNSDNSVEVPVQVVVENQGQGSAAMFKVAMTYTGGVIAPSREFIVAFDVPGQSSGWYPFTDGPLAPGASVIFDGKLIFHPEEHNTTVSLSAMADSCAGDELMPTFCRVRESDETNNKSTPISVQLP